MSRCIRWATVTYSLDGCIAKLGRPFPNIIILHIMYFAYLEGWHIEVVLLTIDVCGLAICIVCKEYRDTCMCLNFINGISCIGAGILFCNLIGRPRKVTSVIVKMFITFFRYTIPHFQQSIPSPRNLVFSLMNQTGNGYILRALHGNILIAEEDLICRNFMLELFDTWICLLIPANVNNQQNPGKKLLLIARYHISSRCSSLLL